MKHYLLAFVHPEVKDLVAWICHSPSGPVMDPAKAENGRIEKWEEPEFSMTFFFWATELTILELLDFWLC